MLRHLQHSQSSTYLTEGAASMQDTSEERAVEGTYKVQVTSQVASTGESKRYLNLPHEFGRDDNLALLAAYNSCNFEH